MNVRSLLLVAALLCLAACSSGSGSSGPNGDADDAGDDPSVIDIGDGALDEGADSDEADLPPTDDAEDADDAKDADGDAGPPDGGDDTGLPDADAADAADDADATTARDAEDPDTADIVEPDAVCAPDLFCEHDDFGATRAIVVLGLPGGESERVTLYGTMSQDVAFEGSEGDANDDSFNGLDEVVFEITELELEGVSSAGIVTLRRRAGVRSGGLIEERENSNPGLLDIDPFAVGDADSYVDLFLELTVGRRVLHTDLPVRVEGLLRSKPASGGDTYHYFDGSVPLLGARGGSTAFSIESLNLTPSVGTCGDGVVEPGEQCESVCRGGGLTCSACLCVSPPVCGLGDTCQIDFFSEASATITISSPDGETTVPLSGTMDSRIRFEDDEGDATDDNFNGLDDLETEITGMSLFGVGDLGVVVLTLSTTRPTQGMVEERVNNSVGSFDVPPFGEGSITTTFDMHFDVSIDGSDFYNEAPLTIAGDASFSPPLAGEFLVSGPGVPVLDPDGNYSGYVVTELRLFPSGAE